MRTGMGRAACGAAAAALAFGLASSAQAQTRDDRTLVRVQIDEQAIRQVTREITRDIGREVREVVRVVTDPQVSQFISQTIRDAIKIGLEQGGRGAQVGSNNRNYRAEQTSRETKTLQLGANGSLELRNLSGDITINAGTGKETIVEIIRTSHGRTDEDAKLGLQRVTASVDQRGERAIVEAKYETARNAPYSVDVDYVVTAPAGVGIRINSMSGDATIRGMKSDVAVEVMSGDIAISGASRVSKVHTFSGNVTLTDIETGDALTAGTISGDVLLQRVKARRVDVDVTSGDIRARDLTVEGASLKTLSGDVEFTSPISKGGRYELQSHSGEILFSPSGGVGYELQVSTFNGEIDPADTTLKIKVISKTRTSFRGTVGDGSAFVTATTFSGDVVLGRKR